MMDRRKTLTAYYEIMRKLQEMENQGTELALLIEHILANESGTKILAHCEAHGLEDQHRLFVELSGQALSEIDEFGIDGEIRQRKLLLKLCREHDIDEPILKLIEEDLVALKKLKPRRIPHMFTESWDVFKIEVLVLLLAVLPSVITVLIWMLLFAALYWWLTF